MFISCSHSNKCTSNVHWGHNRGEDSMNGASRGAQGSCVGPWDGANEVGQGLLALTARHVFTLQGFYMTRTHCLKRPGTLTSSTLLR